MSDLGDSYREMRKRSRRKRDQNRRNSTRLLSHSGIRYEQKNGGVHLIIVDERIDHKIDFWPGTGKWIPRGGVARRGVKRLIDYFWNRVYESIH